MLCICAAIVLLAALPPSPARATKEYARNEGKDCSHCHISDKGSGPRNATGKEYEANGYRFVKQHVVDDWYVLGEPDE